MWRLAHHRALPTGDQPRRCLTAAPHAPGGCTSLLDPVGRYGRPPVDDSSERAVEEARLVLDARQELYGESDPVTFDAMLQLGRTLRDAGRLREAERVLTSSLSLQNRLAEPDEVRLRWTDFNLAIVFDRLGEHEAARRLWERVLESADRDDGPDSELSRQTATNLAITLRKLRRYGDEFPLRVRVLDSTRRVLGPDSGATIRAEIDLAQTHRHLGNHELALGLFAQALAGLERTGGDQRTILYQKWAIATELVALKRSQEASQMFDEVVAGAIEHLEPDDPFRRSAVRQRRGYWLLGKFSGRGRKPRRG